MYSPGGYHEEFIIYANLLRPVFVNQSSFDESHPKRACLLKLKLEILKNFTVLFFSLCVTMFMSGVPFEHVSIVSKQMQI